VKTYEGMFIFPTSLAEDALAQAVEKVKSEIVRAGGQIADAVLLGRRNFSRLMDKQEAGNYLRVRFDLDPGGMAPLAARFKLNEQIFRQQIVVAEPPVVLEPRDAEPQ
jgi:ribosomal protein S6